MMDGERQKEREGGWDGAEDEKRLESPPCVGCAPMHVSYEEETSRNNSGGDFIAISHLHFRTTA